MYKVGDRVKVTAPKSKMYGRFAGKTYTGTIEKINRKSYNVGVNFPDKSYIMVYLPR